MPSIYVQKEEFLREIGRKLSDEEAEQVLFDFGLELDDVFEENGKIHYKVEIPANRYDLLCLQGLAHGVSSYMQNRKQKTLNRKTNGEEVLGKRPATRPYIKLAILKNVDLSNGKYQDLIDFQDKLHQGLGLNRTLVAIGTYDYDKTSRPYTYAAVSESAIKFVPLSQKKEFTRAELAELYKTDPKLKEYVNLNRENGAVPVLQDAKGTILSVPPLINGESTKITPETKNLLIDVTGTDIPRINTAMYLLQHHFSKEGAEIEEFNTECKETEKETYTVTSENVKKELGLDISADVARAYLEKMMHAVKVVEEGERWSLLVYPSRLRPDVLHLCDLVEDLAIAHGYNNFPKISSSSYSVGQEHPFNKRADEIRRECAIVGYTEMYNMALLSKEDYTGFSPKEHIQVRNPKSSECEVLRQDLAPSVLKCVSSNQHHQLPIKIFEISDVGKLDKSDIGVRNEKRMCMCIAGATSGLETLQEAFDVVMKWAGMCVTYKEEDHALFVKQRACRIYLDGRSVGHLGVVNFQTTAHHNIPLVCSLVEVSLTDLFEIEG